MNICFFIGKIISDIKFDFIINNKNNISISLFILELNDNNKIKIEGYNDIADFCYKEIKKEDRIVLEGHINNKMNIEINKIKLEIIKRIK